jgi:hypothetical protein
VVTYDHYLDYSSEAGSNCPRQVFVDAEGIAIFGGTRFLRASLDGALVRAVDYPLNPETGMPAVFWSAARSPSGYGVVFTVEPAMGWPEISFCMFREDGSTELAQCAKPPTWGGHIANPTWDGSAYRLYGHVDQVTMYMARYAADGTFLDQATFPSANPDDRIGLPLFTDEFGIVLADTWRPDTQCRSFMLEVMPRSLDTANLRRYDLLPADAVSDGRAYLVGTGRRAALIYGGQCAGAAPYNPCQPGWPSYIPGTFVTVLGEDGTPLLPPRQVPSVAQPMAWDGARFVRLVGIHNGVGLDAFDENLSFEYENARLPLAWERGHELLDDLSSNRIAAVGDNDYVLVYCLADTGETWIARFQIPPA